MTAPRRIVHGIELSGHTHRVVNEAHAVAARLFQFMEGQLANQPGFRAMPVAPIPARAGGAR